MNILLKDAMPRLYGDLKKYFEMNKREYVIQLDLLQISGCCDCGSSNCLTFYCDVDNAPRPLYCDMLSMPIAIYYGQSNDKLTGFEILSDYEDNYIREILSTLFNKEILEDEEM